MLILTIILVLVLGGAVEGTMVIAAGVVVRVPAWGWALDPPRSLHVGGLPLR